MVVGTKIPTSNRRRRTHGSVSHQLRSRSDDKTSDSTVVDSSDPDHRPDVEELRRVRAEFYNRPLQDRRRAPRNEMEPNTSRRRASRVKQPLANAPEVVAQEARKKHDSERRHHRRKVKEELAGGEDYVYRYVGDDQRSRAPEKLQYKRRPTTTTTKSKDEPETVRVRGASLSRRNTARRTSHQREDTNPPSRLDRRLSSDANVNNVRSRPTVARSSSMRETHTARISRSPLTRSQTTSRKARRSSFSLSTPPVVEEKLERRTSSAKNNQRAPSIFSAIFGLPKPVEPVPEKQVECLTCLSSDIPISKSAKLACQHRMCHSCLRRIFTMSVSDPQHMPPKCCTQEHIPLKHVEKLFDLRFKMKWNQKYQEYTTKNRIYCPAKGCGEWIKPANIHTDSSNGGRKYGKCARCRTKACTICNGKWHASRDCPKDEATQRFAEIAKEQGWQRCFNCSAIVELKEGCNHMTCRCRAEFCMICGLKWKTCNCPWFNYEAVENDRLNHMNFAQRRAGPALGVAPAVAHPNPALGYQEELDRRREQERRDEMLARRMQILGLDAITRPDHPTPNFFRPPPPPPPPLAPHQDFLLHAANILSGTYGPAPAHRMPLPRHQLPLPRGQPFPGQQPDGRHHERAQTRPIERVMPRRAVVNDYAAEEERHNRPVVDGVGAGAGAVADMGAGNGNGTGNGNLVGGGRRHSALAGLTRRTVEGRVDEWRRHVGDD